MTYLTVNQTIQAYYLGLFGRAADPEGLTYWSSRLADEDIDSQILLTSLTDSDEFTLRREDTALERWVDELYLGLFAREADADGAAYWANQAAQGLSPNELLQRFIDAAGPIDAQALSAHTAIADFYSRQVDADRYDAAQPLLHQGGLRSNEQLYADLALLDETFDSLTVEQFGESLEGRPLYAASVGEGSRTVMILTQQHGDEPTGTESAMYLLEWLSGDSELALALRAELNIVVMPRVNPDGFARWEQLVAGDLDPADTVAPRRNSADIDLNRTWDTSEDIDPSLVPETMAMRQVLAAFEPDLVLDYHNQNNYVNDAGMLETMSVLWPTHEDVRSDVTTASKQAAVAVSAGLDKFDFGYLSLFPGGDTPQIARNGLALDGYPVLLVEQRGLEEMQILARGGNLQSEYAAVSSALILEGLLSMLGVLEAMAEDGFAAIDPLLAELIPPRGERTPYEDIYSEAQWLALEGSAEVLHAEERFAMHDSVTDTVTALGASTFDGEWALAG